MEDIYTLADPIITQKIGEKLKKTRLKQNITQMSLAQEAGISLSTLKKLENGEIASFDPLLRTLRTLGLLEVLLPLVEEEQLSPNEYYELVNSVTKKTRKRASGNSFTKTKTESEW
ncbi:MAG: helix-turn-helix transcriptional regulator [Bacteroidaceae bacterium]|nr:helix-turn-helix transcriptional regulator [Bacteroidaceae bacterium]